MKSLYWNLFVSVLFFPRESGFTRSRTLKFYGSHRFCRVISQMA